MVKEKKIVLRFSYCKSMRHDDPPPPLDAMRYDWQDLCRVPPNIATY